MSTWALLAPGPSASAGQAAAVHDAGIPLGAIGNAHELAPHADFIAATDSAWWRKYPEAASRDCQKFTMHTVRGVTHVRIPVLGVCNSGVLGLECAKRQGATRILLLGFDMHGSHFFGQYTNGLSNTADNKRKVHLRQYAQWAKANSGIEVLNCTPGSALQCFPTASIDDLNRYLQVGDAGIPGEVHVESRQHATADGGATLQEAAPVHLHYG